MFLVTSPDLISSTESFKVPEDVFYEVISKEGFSKTYIFSQAPLDTLRRYKSFDKKRLATLHKTILRFSRGKIAGKDQKAIRPDIATNNMEF